MQIQMHYQGLESSPWLDQYIARRVSKLERYLSPSASIQVNIKFENREYSTGLVIHNTNHDYNVSSSGINLYESFSSALDKAARVLSEEKRKLKDKINRKFFSLKKDQAC